MTKQKTINHLFLFIIAVFTLLLAQPAAADNEAHLVEGFSDYSGDGIRSFTLANSVAVDSDGMIVTLSADGGVMFLERVSPDGTFDTTFCGSGLCEITPPLPIFHPQVALQSDGRILIGGITNGDPSQHAVMRLQADGTLDPTFTITTVPIGVGSALVNTIFVDEDDSFYMAGYSHSCTLPFICDSEQRFSIIRYLKDGGVDTSFDEDGKVVVNFGLRAQFVKQVLKQPDGRLVLVGYKGNDDQDNWAVARLLPNGNQDNTFDNDGEQAGSSNGYGYHAILQPDGKLIVASEDELIRLTVEGQVDSSFGNNGRMRPQTPLGFMDGLMSMTYLANGNLLVVGVNDAAIADRALLAASYTADMELDPSFGNGVGAVRIDIPDHLNPQHITEVSLNKDGRVSIIAAPAHGAVNRNANVAVRIFPDGTLDTGGWMTHDISDASDTFNDVAILPDGKIVGLGTVLDGGMGLARYHADGSPDTTLNFGFNYLTNPTPRTYGQALAIDSLNRMIVLRGHAEHDAAPINYKVPRYQSNGLLALWPNGNAIGGPIGQWGGSSNFPTNLVLHPDERFAVIGSSDGDVHVTQYTPEGRVDQTYGVDGTILPHRLAAGYKIPGGATVAG